MSRLIESSVECKSTVDTCLVRSVVTDVCTRGWLSSSVKYSYDDEGVLRILIGRVLLWNEGYRG